LKASLSATNVMLRGGNVEEKRHPALVGDPFASAAH
jgi:hypothetical protein